jgi:hypothetical protein
MQDVLDKAREAGMAVLLDACIGSQRFHSVVGSEAALARFAALCESGCADPETLSRWADLCERGAGASVGESIRSVLDARNHNHSASR